jgi:outer membrane protein TolC
MRSEWLLADRRSMLLADLAQAHAEMSEALASTTTYRDKLIPLASEYVEAAVADYQSGRGSFINVITAQQRRLDTELAQARARADFARHLAELERWAGGPLNPAAILETEVQP